MSEEKSFKLSPSAAILIAGIIIAGAIVVTRNSPQPTAAAVGNVAAPSALPSTVRKPSASDHIVGSPTAPIVLIEYSDFQCPYCEVIYPTLKKIVDESNGQISLVYRQFPLTSIHPQANPAANAAECIAAQLGNDGFWKYADAVFKNQSQLSASYSAQLAKEFGANMTTYNQCVANSTYQKNIDADSQEVQGIGGSGTPYVVVLNTKSGKAAVIPGALPYTQAMQVIKSVQ
ncbi:DsbA family protein [Patescibacteria group bacterium]|nr:DsbA family protein [Patescibacteria group bacterium]